METFGNYMWVQNESANSKDTFIINGNISQYEGNDEQDKAFGKMQKIRELAQRRAVFASGFKNFVKEISNYKVKNPDRNISDSFQCYQDKKNESTLIYSCHANKDYDGRNMPFIFLSYTLDINKVCDKLKEYSSLIGRECNDDEIDMLKEIVKKNDYKFLIVLITILIIISIIWIIIHS